MAYYNFHVKITKFVASVLTFSVTPVQLSSLYLHLDVQCTSQIQYAQIELSIILSLKSSTQVTLLICQTEPLSSLFWITA